MKHVLKSNTTLTNVKQEDIQPNAIDLRLDRIFVFSAPYSEEFKISNEDKKPFTKQELFPADDWWQLGPGCYEVIMENIVKMGENEAGWVITRSTLSRNGVFITGGLYDSGYHGVMAATLNVTRNLTIKKGTRIGQFLLFDADMLHKYDGSYGLAKEHDKLYQPVE